MMDYLEDLDIDIDEDVGFFENGFSVVVDLLDAAVSYVPKWPPTWIQEGPPDWLLEASDKYMPEWPHEFFKDLSQHGLPHIYIQQDVCEKAFDVGILILTLGTLLLFIFLFRRWLRPRAQSENWVCPSCISAEKSEVLSEDLVNVEKRVDLIKTTCQNVSKKLQSCLQGQGTDGPALEKRLKKMPEMLLSSCMLESATALGELSVLGNILGICGNSQKDLSNELLQYEVEVEKMVVGKQVEILDNEVPSIAKLRKHLAKLTLDMDSARTRYQTAARHSIQANAGNAGKAEVIKEEMDDASLKVEQCRDTLSAEMFALISRESELAQHLVHLVKTQADYHKKVFGLLERYTKQMEDEIKHHPSRRTYGCLLPEHLEVTERQIALPIEACVCFLLEYGVNEEGLFRIAGSTSKMKKLKAAFDANIFGILDMNYYSKDPHAVAGALKSYLRELPVPLMTHELYSEWMQVSRVSDADSRLQAMWVVLHKMKEPYASNLRYLIKFLAKLSQNHEVNKMSSQNLAIVIAPNLIWAPDEEKNMSMNMSLANTYSLLVDHLISQADWFFPGDIEFFITTPPPKSPHEGGFLQSDFDIPANGEMDIHPSNYSRHVQDHFQSASTQDGPYSNHSSPQSGGSPKSLRRNKKPPPPVPPVMLREKPSFSEKPVPAERTERLSTERTVERNDRLSADRPPDRPSTPEKPSLERKHSAPLVEPEKPQVPSKNHIERSQSTLVPGEKPLIPEKPSLERKPSPFSEVPRLSSSTAAPLAATESQAIEKTPEQPLSLETLGQTVTTEIQPATRDDSKTEIVFELQSPEPPSADTPYKRRARSPMPKADRYDMYRPTWYGSEDLEPEPAPPPAPMFVFRIPTPEDVYIPPKEPTPPVEEEDDLIEMETEVQTSESPVQTEIKGKASDTEEIETEISQIQANEETFVVSKDENSNNVAHSELSTGKLESDNSGQDLEPEKLVPDDQHDKEKRPLTPPDHLPSSSEHDVSEATAEHFISMSPETPTDTMTTSRLHSLGNVGRSASSEEGNSATSSLYGRQYSHFMPSEYNTSITSPGMYSTQSYDRFQHGNRYGYEDTSPLYPSSSYDRYLHRDRSESPELPRHFATRSYELYRSNRYGSMEHSSTLDSASTGSQEDVMSSERSVSPERTDSVIPRNQHYDKPVDRSPSPLRSSMVVVSSSYDPYVSSQYSPPSPQETSIPSQEASSRYQLHTEAERPLSPDPLVLRSTSPVYFLRPERAPSPQPQVISSADFQPSYFQGLVQVPASKPPRKPERTYRRAHTSSYGSLPRNTNLSQDQHVSMPTLPIESPGQLRKQETPRKSLGGDRPEKPPRPSSLVGKEELGQSGDRLSRPSRPERPPQPIFDKKYENVPVSSSHQAGRPSSRRDSSSRVSSQSSEGLHLSSSDRSATAQITQKPSGVPSSPVAPRRPPRPQPPPPPPPLKPRMSSSNEDTHL